MTDTREFKSDERLNEDVLLLSWAQFSVYDRTAAKLKTDFIQRRQVVIFLTLIATIASVSTGLLGQTILAIVLAIISIALPLVASYLMNDVIKFTGTTAWIKYRYIAEMMRMHIYLYRMHSDVYAGTVHEMDDLLVKNLSALRDQIKWDEIIPPTTELPRKRDDILTVIKEANPKPESDTEKTDDGLSEIDIDDYIKWRLDYQQAWYDGKIKDDFAAFKVFVRLAQVSLLFGALVSAIAGASNVQLVTLVAATTAISSALTAMSNVRMVGKTYSIFQIASDQLGDYKRAWSGLKDNPSFISGATRQADTRRFVASIENILCWERQEWYEMALQAQSVGDKLILGDLARLTERAQKAQSSSPTADPASTA